MRLDTPLRLFTSEDTDTIGRIAHPQMNMVVLAVEFHQLGFAVPADAGKDQPHVVQYRLGEHVAPVFGHEDQMSVHQKDAMPTVPNVLVCGSSAKCKMDRCNVFKPSNSN